MRITVSGKRAEMSTGKTVDPDRWNGRSGRASGTKEDARTLNVYFDSLQNKVSAAHQALMNADRTITAESLQNQFLGKAKKSRYLMELFAEHNTKIKALIGNGFEPNTLKGYKTSERHLKGFLQSQYGKPDIEIGQLDYSPLVQD